MKGVTDLFISKDKLAMFWFLVTCACVVGTAMHLHSVAIEGRSRMLYVPIDQGDVFYIDRSLDKQDLDELIDFQTRLAIESYLNRGPRGPVTAERLRHLFIGQAAQSVSEDIQKNSYDFRNRQVHQMAEVGEIRVLHNDDGSAVIRASGQVVRVSLDPTGDHVVNESFTVISDMTWERNRNMRDSKRFPFVCTTVAYTLTPISTSE